ncbi:MAG: nucleotidyltransferase family protein [Candidatus Micrarchaeota archaeon]|nr:nucleotidyltransferase family protein [Candidatus Micrarchaeota archaeon]
MTEKTKNNSNEKETEAKNNNKYGAILLCGGRGTRLRELTHDEIPKSLVKVEGKELIGYSIDDMLYSKMVDKLVFAVGYKSEQIINYVNNLKLDTKVEFSYQSKPGVLCAVKEAAAHIEGSKVIFCNSDEIRVNLHLDEAILYHETSSYVATMVATYTDALHEKGVLELDDKNVVLKLRLRDSVYASKPEETGLVNAGIVIMNKSAIDYFDPSYEKDWMGIIEPLIRTSNLRAYIDSNIKFLHGNTREQVSEAKEYIGKLQRNKK